MDHSKPASMMRRGDSSRVPEACGPRRFVRAARFRFVFRVTANREYK
jgi:hypothetical protein